MWTGKYFTLQITGILLSLLFLNNAFASPDIRAELKAGSNLSSTTFEVIRGIIIVEAEIDGSKANFILDTGSPTMILNEFPEEADDYQAVTLQGSLAGEWKKIRQFSWAGVRKFDLDALTMDISHLEYITQKQIRGLIGYEFFSDFDLLLDFKGNRVTLLPYSDSNQFEDYTLRTEIPFQLEGHIPVIEAKIGAASFRFGLDTGAGVNLLDLSRKDEIPPEFLAPINNASVIGLSSGAEEIIAADVLETTIAGVNYWNMRYLFSNISHLRNLVDNNVDGLLGYPFFQSGIFTINYGKRVISFWEETSKE